MVYVNVSNTKYSAKIGLIKTLKNTAIMYGLPALLFFLNNYSEWLPVESVAVLAPLIGGISYVVKNYIENK